MPLTFLALLLIVWPTPHYEGDLPHSWDQALFDAACLLELTDPGSGGPFPASAWLPVYRERYNQLRDAPPRATLHRLPPPETTRAATALCRAREDNLLLDLRLCPHHAGLANPRLDRLRECRALLAALAHAFSWPDSTYTTRLLLLEARDAYGRAAFDLGDFSAAWSFLDDFTPLDP